MLLDQMTFGNPLASWREVVYILLSITLHNACECNDSTLYHTILRFACRQALQGQPGCEEPANRTIAIICGSQAHQFIGNARHNGYQHDARKHLEEQRGGADQGKHEDRNDHHNQKKPRTTAGMHSRSAAYMGYIQWIALLHRINRLVFGSVVAEKTLNIGDATNQVKIADQ